MFGGWPLRKKILAMFIFICTVAVFTVFSQTFLMHANEIRFYSRHVMLLEKAKSKLSGNLSATCQIPNNDPFHPTIMQYSKNFKLTCNDGPYLTFVDEEGYIHLNKTGFDAINKTIENVLCKFHTISGVEGEKNKYVYGPKINISTEPVKINAQYVRVQCVDDYKEHIYETCQFHVPPPNHKLQQKNINVKEQGRTNVLLLAIDSVSRLSFIRNLPKSYKFLTNQLQSVIMKGFNKAGKNTHPNMIPFLTGYRMYKDDVGQTPAVCNNSSNCTGYFDHLPIVWNNFSQAGYVTMWFDEWLIFQLFYYDAKGFEHVPTDYYPRPLIQMLESIGVTNNGFCYGNTPTFNVELDYTEKFIKAMKDTIYFAFSFIARISHDDDNTVKALDDRLQEFLEKLYINGDLNNTILILFGDHGRRFGEIRRTLIGAVEDRMPFMSIYLPERIRKQKPHMQAALEINSGRLSSWFDMYEMLMDLAMDNLEVVSRVTRWGFSVGLSPIRTLPENRTCEQAGIPLEYCVCMTPIDIEITEDVVLQAAKHIVDHVNSRLRSVPGHPCAVLSLHKIESAQVLSHAQNVMTPHGFIELLRVTIKTLPSNAVLQATIERQASNEQGIILGDVERLNKYRNQSTCVDSYIDRGVRPYCFCLPGHK